MQQLQLGSPALDPQQSATPHRTKAASAAKDGGGASAAAATGLPANVLVPLVWSCSKLLGAQPRGSAAPAALASCLARRPDLHASKLPDPELFMLLEVIAAWKLEPHIAWSQALCHRLLQWTAADGGSSSSTGTGGRAGRKGHEGAAAWSAWDAPYAQLLMAETAVRHLTVCTDRRAEAELVQLQRQGQLEPASQAADTAEEPEAGSRSSSSCGTARALPKQVRRLKHDLRRVTDRLRNRLRQRQQRQLGLGHEPGLHPAVHRPPPETQHNPSQVTSPDAPSREAPPRQAPFSSVPAAERLAALQAAVKLGALAPQDWSDWGVGELHRLARELPPASYPRFLDLLARLWRAAPRGALEEVLLTWCAASAPYLPYDPGAAAAPAGPAAAAAGAAAAAAEGAAAAAAAPAAGAAAAGASVARVGCMSPQLLHRTLLALGRAAGSLHLPVAPAWVSDALPCYTRSCAKLPPALLAQVPAVLAQLHRVPPPRWQMAYVAHVRQALPYMQPRAARSMLADAAYLSPELAQLLRVAVREHMSAVARSELVQSSLSSQEEGGWERGADPASSWAAAVLASKRRQGQEQE